MSDAEAAAADEAERFWAWSESAYAAPGVAPALIRLQDEAGLDVNAALLAAYLATDGRRLTAAALAAGLAASAAWTTGVVRVARAARRAAKGDASAYQALKAGEIAAEKVAQRLLLRGVLGLRPDPGGTLGANLRIVASAFDLTPDATATLEAALAPVGT